MGLDEDITINETYVGLSTRAKVLSIKDVHIYETKYLRCVMYLDTFEHRKALMDEVSFKKYFKKLGDKA